MKTLIIILIVVVIASVSLFLLSVHCIITDIKRDLDTGNDHDFPNGNIGFSDLSKWNNLELFKRIAYKLAEKDEEIKNYLLACKNKHDSHATNIHGGGVGRKANSQDIPSDIQRD